MRWIDPYGVEMETLRGERARARCLYVVCGMLGWVLCAHFSLNSKK